MRAKKKSMSESAQAFYLRLNNHKSFLTEALTELYHNEILVDCTLTAKGGQLRAHQTVLSACSPYLKEIFAQQNNNQYPVIVIKDMPFNDLKAIVEYIYCGEVTIPRPQLRSILGSGALLQVKGLYEFNQEKLSEIDASAGNECVGADNKSNVRQSDKDYLENNSVNSCESNGNIYTNEKETRKSSKNREKSFNGYDRETKTLCKTLSFSDMKRVDNICTNDVITNNNDNINDSLKREYSLKNPMKQINGSKRVAQIKSKSSETSFEPKLISSNIDEHNMEKPMTGKPVLNTVSGGADNIVPLMPFAPLQQSFMIDVNPNVNQASYQSDFCFDLTNNESTYNTATTGAVSSQSAAMPERRAVEDLNKTSKQQQNPLQNEMKDKINDINICINKNRFRNLFNEIPALNRKSFDVNQTQCKSRKRSLISATDEKQKRQVFKVKTLKECEGMEQAKGDSLLRTDSKHDRPASHKARADKSTKKIMRKAHTSHKKYMCSFCHREYDLSHALDTHIKTHQLTDDNKLLQDNSKDLLL